MPFLLGSVCRLPIYLSNAFTGYFFPVCLRRRCDRYFSTMTISPYSRKKLVLYFIFTLLYKWVIKMHDGLFNVRHQTDLENRLWRNPSESFTSWHYGTHCCCWPAGAHTKLVLGGVVWPCHPEASGRKHIFISQEHMVPVGLTALC